MREAKALKTAGREASFVAHAQRDRMRALRTALRAEMGLDVDVGDTEGGALIEREVDKDTEEGALIERGGADKGKDEEVGGVVGAVRLIRVKDESGVGGIRGGNGAG